MSSKISAVTSADVKEDFGKKIKYILEGGKSSIGLESTILDFRKKPIILRLGGLKISSIEKVIKRKINIDINPNTISSPGQSKLHYSPGLPIRLNAINIKSTRQDYFLKKIKRLKKTIFIYQKMET